MGTSAISGANKLFSFDVGDTDKWFGDPALVFGPIIDVRGMAYGSVFVNYGASLAFGVVSEAGYRVPTGANTGKGRDYGTANDQDGAALPGGPVTVAGGWSMIDYRYFFFPFWQIVSAAPTGNQRIVFHLKR